MSFICLIWYAHYAVKLICKLNKMVVKSRTLKSKSSGLSLFMVRKKKLDSEKSGSTISHQ